MIVLKLLKLVAQLLAIGIFFLPSIYPRIRVSIIQNPFFPGWDWVS